MGGGIIERHKVFSFAKNFVGLFALKEKFSCSKSQENFYRKIIFLSSRILQSSVAKQFVRKNLSWSFARY